MAHTPQQKINKMDFRWLFLYVLAISWPIDRSYQWSFRTWNDMFFFAVCWKWIMGKRHPPGRGLFWGHLSVPTKRLLLWVFFVWKQWVSGIRYLYPTKNCWVPDLLCSVGALFRMTWRIDWFGLVTNQFQCHIPKGNLALKKHNFSGASCEFYGFVVFCFRLRQADVWQKSKATVRHVRWWWMDNRLWRLWESLRSLSAASARVYSVSNNHGGGKWTLWRLPRAPFSTDLEEVYSHQHF